MLPRSMSTRTLSAGTNKMSITCGCPHRAGLRLRRRLQLVQPQRLRLRQQRPLRPRRRLQPQPQPQPLLRPHQHQQLLLLPDRPRRRELRQRREPDPHHDLGRSYGVLSPCWRLAAPRQSEAATINLPTRALCEFSDFSLVTNQSEIILDRFAVLD